MSIANKPKAVPKPKVEEPEYQCMTCGKTKKESDFFKSQWTKVWIISGKRVLFCKDCVDKLMDEYTKRYGEETALMICCALLDIPFNSITYHSIIENNSIFNVGLYIRILNGRQWQYKNFSYSIVDGQLSKTENEIKEEIQSRWSKTDKQNMNYALSVVGYDPFDNCNMTDGDRKYCFNILAGYCDSEGIKEDGHKIQSVVQITQLQLQCRKIDEFVNAELLGTYPDDGRIKQLTTTKKQLLDSISKLAQDNNLSSAYNKSSEKGSNTLSEKMKQIEKDGYEAIKVNLFDIKTCGAIKQIADISNQSILDQLTLDANDYTQMIKEQRELIEKYRQSSEEFEEENRMLKNKLADIEISKKGR